LTVIEDTASRKLAALGLDVSGIRPNGALILLGLSCTLAAVEAMAAFLEYRTRLHAEDWDAVRELVAENEAPVIAASEWLGPSARMNLASARSWDAIAFPDLRSFEHFWVLTHTREQPWKGWLRAELEELPRPELVSVHRVGELSLHEYRQEITPERFSLLESIDQVSTEKGRCSGKDGRWSCKDGRVSVRTVEVDYRPRRCLAIELDDGVMASVELGKLELGERIHGHLGFADFNARLRADPSARVELVIDEEVAARWVFTDDQGWAAFALATPAGKHELELRVGTTTSGTWQRDGHRSSPSDIACIELRGFGDGGEP
jgi:hypothetical protein